MGREEYNACASLILVQFFDCLYNIGCLDRAHGQGETHYTGIVLKTVAYFIDYLSYVVRKEYISIYIYGANSRFTVSQYVRLKNRRQWLLYVFLLTRVFR